MGIRTIANIAVGAAMAVSLAAAATPAQAMTDPGSGGSSCMIFPHPVAPEGRMSYCSYGSAHRIVLRCNPGRYWGEPDFWVYGPWAAAGRYSATSCITGKVTGFYRSSSIQRA